LQNVNAGSAVSFDTLVESKITTKSKLKLHKIVLRKAGAGAVADNITVQAHGFNSSARAAIEAAGGKCEVLSPTNGQAGWKRWKH
jgi:large subunit ribosomal protein L15